MRCCGPWGTQSKAVRNRTPLCDVVHPFALCQLVLLRQTVTSHWRPPAL